MARPNPELPVQSGMVDTHCHLFLVDREPSLVVETAREAGVERLLCVGVDPATSVCDPAGRVHGTTGLYVADASLIPTNLGVNPQHTIMALSRKIAEDALSV